MCTILKNRSIWSACGAICLLTLSAATPSSGQSFLSAAGLGEMRWYQTGRAYGMGEAGLAVVDEQEYNRWNPALSVFFPMAAFNGSFTLDHISMSQQEAKLQNRLTRWSGGSLSVKITDYVALTIGAAPLTDYDFQMETANEGSPFQRELLGTGGFSTIYGSLAVKPLPFLALGWGMHRLTGHTQDLEVVTFDDGGLVPPENRTRNSLDGYTHTLSAAVRTPAGITLGGFLQPKADLSGEQRFTGTKAAGTPIGPFDEPVTAELPLMYGVGASIIGMQRLHLAVDYLGMKSGDMHLDGAVPSYVTDARRFGAGFEFLPKPSEGDAPQSEGAVYRVGFFRQRAYIRDIDLSPIDETFVTFGVGALVLKSRTRVNLGVQIGVRGSETADFARERVVRINMSFSTLERWFYRPDRNKDDEEE